MAGTTGRTLMEQGGGLNLNGQWKTGKQQSQAEDLVDLAEDCRRNAR